jgi:hypothetical protein
MQFSLPPNMLHDAVYICMRFEILIVEKMLMVVFRIVTSCGLVGGYQHFGGTGLQP